MSDSVLAAKKSPLLKGLLSDIGSSAKLAYRFFL